MAKSRVFILLAAVVVFSFSIYVFQEDQPAQAGSFDNVSGFAWSENIGWISFNCTDLGSCGSFNYGVNIRDDNYLEGYAWSENIGWISFNLADTGAPPGQYNYSNKGFIAKYDSVQQELRGWARALAGTEADDGWDGWIKLYKHSSDGGANYGVNYNQSTKELSGWAWSDSVIGWISFNCQDTGACGSSSYKVVVNLNQPPSATSLSAQLGDYCGSPYPPAYLSWNFSDPDSGDTQSAYRVQIDTNAGFSSPDIDSGKISGSGREYAPANLSYNTTYHWRAKVWDSVDEESSWATGPTFQTALHPYPSPDFSWTPQFPVKNEVAEFEDQTTFYNGGLSWDWNFGDGGVSSAQNPTHAYASENSYSVSLRATDSSGFSCSVAKSLSVELSLPGFFKEIIPF